MTSSSLVAVATEPPDLSSASFQHGGKACFGSRPPSAFAHRTTVPSHWAWESGLCKSRQSGLKESPAQKRPGANTVGERNLRSFNIQQMRTQPLCRQLHQTPLGPASYIPHSFAWCSVQRRPFILFSLWGPGRVSMVTQRVSEREGGLTDGDFLFQLHDTSTKRAVLKERGERSGRKEVRRGGPSGVRNRAVDPGTGGEKEKPRHLTPLPQTPCTAGPKGTNRHLLPLQLFVSRGGRGSFATEVTLALKAKAQADVTGMERSCRRLAVMANDLSLFYFVTPDYKDAMCCKQMFEFP
ncbi:hypothetical protein E1301_Tti002284 [Triplophysa tibetana]|uniref:Uncharacterized protein n=1 Tax=Triplophysa tibetana TaxID=1572043 RepID=A0A5A9NAF6_9TELE|nr:hypothetical protein E1301_Tti002284 [Triplophysa tibetana]